MPVLFYNNGYKPAKCRDLVKVPPYTFGWIVPKVDIFKALHPSETPNPQRLFFIRRKMEICIASLTENSNYGPSSPEVEPFDEDYIRVILASNETNEMIDRIMADKAYHDKCRDCFNNPQSMAMEPVWILSGISRVPKGLYVPMESLPESTKVPSFPKFYNNGTKPAKCRDFVKVPPYTFGWIVPKVDIFKAFHPIETPNPQRLFFIRRKMEICIASLTENSNYGPSSPEIEPFDEDHIRVVLASNESDEMMDRIMADKAYHDECRSCFNNPPSMAMEPAWILSGITRVPKGLLPE